MISHEYQAWISEQHEPKRKLAPLVMQTSQAKHQITEDGIPSWPQTTSRSAKRLIKPLREEQLPTQAKIHGGDPLMNREADLGLFMRPMSGQHNPGQS